MNDAELINYHGGPAKVAELLNFDKTAGGVQRVQNWRTRGIPSKVKLDHPHLFIVPAGAVTPAVPEQASAEAHHDAAAPLTSTGA